MEKKEHGMEQESHPTKKYGKLSGSTAAKAAAFNLFAIAFFVGLGGMMLCLYMGEHGFYVLNENQAVARVLYQRGGMEAANVQVRLERGDLAGAEAYCAGRNADVDLWWYDAENGEDKLLWSSSGERNMADCAQITLYVMLSNLERTVTLNNHTLKTKQEYTMNVYFDLSFPKEDDIRQLGRGLVFLYEARYQVIVLAGVSLLISLICFIFLMCSAGHRNGREGITGGVLTGFHFDILTVIFGGVAAAGLMVMANIADGSIYPAVIAVGGTLLAVWMTFYFMDTAIRFKQGHVLKHTLIYVIMRGIGRGMV